MKSTLYVAVDKWSNVAADTDIDTAINRLKSKGFFANRIVELEFTYGDPVPKVKAVTGTPSLIAAMTK